MRIDKVLPEYLAHLKVEQACSPLTLSSYQWELEHLAEYLRQNDLPLDASAIRTPMLRRYLLETQQALDLAPATVARKIFTWRGFFNYCVEQEYCTDNPAKGLKAPAPPRPIPAYLTREELGVLFAVTERLKGAGAGPTRR